MDGFRFRWRRQPYREPTVFSGRLGAFHVGRIVADIGHDGQVRRWRWSIPVLHGTVIGRAGHALTPRTAAREMEAAFSPLALSAGRFAMRLEREIVFRAVLGLPISTELQHAIDVEDGLHVPPLPTSGEAYVRRWIEEERRRGGRSWLRIWIEDASL